MRTNLHHQGGGLATFVMGRSGNLPTPDAEVDKLGEEVLKQAQQQEALIQQQETLKQAEQKVELAHILGEKPLYSGPHQLLRALLDRVWGRCKLHSL